MCSILSRWHARLAAMWVVALVSPLFAQHAPSGPQRENASSPRLAVPDQLVRPRPVSAHELLALPQIRDSLALDGRQLELADYVRHEVDEAQRLAKQRAEAEFGPLLLESLRRDQFARLRWLRLQVQGAVSLVIDEELQEHLRLSDRQIRGLRDVQDGFVAEVERLFAATGDDILELGTLLQDSLQRRDAQLLAQLTARQREQWRALQVEPSR